MEDKEFDLNDLGGITIDGHTYSKLKSVYDIYVGEDGLLGYNGKIIDWETLNVIHLLGIKRGWIK